MKLYINCIISLLLLLAVNNSSSAQLDTILFTSKYLKEKRVKKLTIHYQKKENNQRIEDKPLISELYFDQNARIVKRSEYIIYAKENVDTSIFYYYYNDKNKLTSVRRFHHNTVNAEYFDLDEKGRVLKKIIVKEVLTEIKPEVYTVAKQDLLSKEEFKYDDFSPTQYKAHFLNDEHSEYKYRTVNLNKNGQVKEYYEAFTLSGVYESTVYQYNTYNLLNLETYKSNASGEFTIETMYQYNASDILTEQKVIFNSVLQKERFIFIENELITSELTKRVEDKHMDIKKYTYIFW